MLSWRFYNVSGQGVRCEERSEGLDFAHCVATHSRPRLPGLTDDPGNIEEVAYSVAQEVRHENNGSLCPGCLPW